MMSLVPRPSIARRTLIDELTQGLLDYIADNKLEIGDRLPSISALAKHFAVAAPTVREMARRLESTGVLSIRHGSGIYLTGSNDRLVVANGSRGLLSTVTTLEVLDTRLLIEPELASRAASNRTAGELAELEEIASACDDAVSANDPIALNELNMSFHIQVGRAAGNRVLAEALETVVELHMDHQRKIAVLFANTQRDHEEHSEILNAIAAGDSLTAHSLMKAHIAEVLAVVKDGINDDQKETP